MARIMFVFTLLFAVIGSLALAQTRNVIVPKDGRPFTVKVDDVVRVSAQVIAGGTVKAAVDGPASVLNSSTIRAVDEGKISLGLTTHEFEIRPEDHGKVVVTLTILPPNGEATAKIYQFKVEGQRERFAEKDKSATIEKDKASSSGKDKN